MQFLKALGKSPKPMASAEATQTRLNAAQMYEQAMQLLTQAHEEQFRDPQMLKQASELFIGSIRQNDRNPAPMVGMAYLLILLEEYASAMKYIQAALRIDPRHSSALGLQEVIQERLQEKSESETELLSDEAKFEQLEDYLKAEIQMLSKLPQPQPFTELDPLLEMEGGFVQLREMHGQLLTKLARLGEEFESLSLRSQLQAIERRIKQFEKAIVTSHQLLELRERMEQERDAALCLSQYLSFQNPQQAFTQLEIILDSCDQIALEINTLESQGVDIHVLEVDYQKLSDALMFFQNTLDEMKHEAQPVEKESLAHAG